MSRLWQLLKQRLSVAQDQRLNQEGYSSIRFAAASAPAEPNADRQAKRAVGDHVPYDPSQEARGLDNRGKRLDGTQG